MGHQLDRYDVNLNVDGKIPLRLVYDAESQLAHPGLTGAQVFFKDNGEAIELHMMPRYGEMVPCLHVAFMMLYTAMLAYNDLLTGKPWTDELLSIAEAYGMDKPLPQRQTGK